MPPKNYYLVLGVPRDESAEGIREAYRGLAKRLHPDVAGPSGTAVFQEINEAYAVLSDPALRRQHDAQLAPRLRGTPIPVTRVPYAEQMARRPAAEPMQAAALQVALSPWEASTGCIVPINVPVMGPCPRCEGAGRLWAFVCLDCGGNGTLRTVRRIRVRIPPGVNHGTVLDAGPGMRLRIAVR